MPQSGTKKKERQKKSKLLLRSSLPNKMNLQKTHGNKEKGCCSKQEVGDDKIISSAVAKSVSERNQDLGTEPKCGQPQ